MKLSKQLKEDKKLYNYIQNKISSNKNLYMGKGTNVKLILRNKKKVLNDFISKNKGLQTEYNDLKTENQNFYNTYKNILMHRDNQSYLEKEFRDNFVLYQKKGYKIPNLTTNSNIIKYSPLLMEGQDHINKYFLQDLYLLNKRLKKIYSYELLKKYIIKNNIKFDSNSNSEEEDDDNEKEGINSIFFLKKCDLLVNKAFKDKKGKRVSKSLDINNWFKQDLFANPFLTQGNKMYEECMFDNDINNNIKNDLLNKEIEKLSTYNNELKKNLSKINVFNTNKNNGVNKRHSVLELKLYDIDNKYYNINKMNDVSKRRSVLNNYKYTLPIYNLKTNLTNYNLSKRNNDKKLTLPHKSQKIKKFEEFYHNIISKNKNKDKIKINFNNFLSEEKKPIKSIIKEKKSTKKANSIFTKTKTDKNNLKKNNHKKNTINEKSNYLKFIENIKNKDIGLYEKRFKIYSGKEPKYLFSLINDGKDIFNKANIINIFNKKYKLSKINDMNLRYLFLENYLRQGLFERDLSI